MKLLFIYASWTGHTIKVINYIKDKINISQQFEITTIHVSQMHESMLYNHDAFVLASAVRFGYMHEDFVKFTQKYHKILNSKPNALICVNLTARKLNKNNAENNPYVQKFLLNSDWQPDLISVVAGMLDFKLYPLWQKILLKIIMFISDPSFKINTNRVEFTNWSELDLFINELYEHIIFSNKI